MNNKISQWLKDFDFAGYFPFFDVEDFEKDKHTFEKKYPTIYKNGMSHQTFLEAFNKYMRNGDNWEADVEPELIDPEFLEGCGTDFGDCAGWMNTKYLDNFNLFKPMREEIFQHIYITKNGYEGNFRLEVFTDPKNDNCVICWDLIVD